jgi:hypothetical protein
VKIDLSWLELPEVRHAPFTSASLQYGAGFVAANYCGLHDTPKQINGYWEHGWLSHHRLIDPRVAFGVVEQKHTKETCWVGTQKIAYYLRANGYRAQAIGLPIAYLEPKSYKRKKNSLLVMPAHSLDYTQHEWKFSEYADAIISICNDFEFTAACIHPSCIKHGYWVKEFQKAGIPIICGANANDLNALERVRALMSQFEFVTTNAYGSLLAYGSAFGAKVSIFGKYCNYKANEFSNTPFYQNQPGLIDKTVDLLNEKIVRSVYPDFFCHPIEAKQRVEWGLEQIGWSNRISPAEMRRCFGWQWYHEPLRKTKTYFHIFANRLLTRNARQRLEEWKNPALREENQEIRRIQALPPEGAGAASLAGLEFHFGSAGRFLGEYTRVFQEKALDVPCIKGSPRIIDWGAGEGMPMRYWAQKFPSPNIHLFEPDTTKREILEKNMALAKNAQILLHESAEKMQDLLQGEIDLLRIDMCAEGINLLKRWGDIISCAERLLVTCRSRLGEPQNVSVLLALLERQGFRYHISPRVASANPLVALKTEAGADGVVDVWGYRGVKFPRTS